MTKDFFLVNVVTQHDVDSAQPWWPTAGRLNRPPVTKQPYQRHAQFIQVFSCPWDPIHSLFFYRIILLLTFYQQSSSWCTQKLDELEQILPALSHAVRSEPCLLCLIWIWKQYAQRCPEVSDEGNEGDDPENSRACRSLKKDRMGGCIAASSSFLNKGGGSLDHWVCPLAICLDEILQSISGQQRQGNMQHDD